MTLRRIVNDAIRDGLILAGVGLGVFLAAAWLATL